MALVMRVLQGLLLLAAFLFGVAFVMALGASDTGPVEKVALVAAAAACAWGGITLSSLKARLSARH